jgi:DNA-binding beta-propeller fold protein YncE
LAGRPWDLAFDGQYLWITEASSVRRIDPVTNTYVGSPIAVGDTAYRLVFDGRYIWVETNSSLVRVDRIFNTATVIDDDATWGGIVFDGASIWYTSFDPEQLTKLTP